MSKTLKGLQALLCLTISLNAVAQRDTTHNFIMGLYYTFPFEFPSVDNDAMALQVQNLGYPAPAPRKLAGGFGFQWHLDHCIVNLSYVSSSNRLKTDTTEARTRYRSFAFNMGYDVLHTLHFSLYPFVGFKTCAVNYKFIEKISDSLTSMQNYLTSHLDTKEMANSRIHLDLGVGFAFRTFAMINLRAGYLVPLEKSEWFIPASKSYIANGPNTRFGPYFTLTIGFGNISDDKTNRERAERRRQADEQRSMGITRASTATN